MSLDLQIQRADGRAITLEEWRAAVPTVPGAALDEGVVELGKNPATGKAITRAAKPGTARAGRLLLVWTENGVLLSAPWDFPEKKGTPEHAAVFGLARAVGGRVEAPLLDEPSVLHEDGTTSPMY
jgi:hypothetical protein